MSTVSRLPDLMKRYEAEILKEWIREQLTAITHRTDLMSEAELRRQSSDFLRVFNDASQAGELTDVTAMNWEKAKSMIESISRS
jgi:rsbT co-antagonist protein RsbR